MPVPELLRIAALLAATVNHVRVEFAALGADGAAFHPAPGEWCAKEVVGHMVEADRRGFSGRVREILEGERPVLQAWDQAGVAAARNDCGRTMGDVLDEFAGIRREGLALLEEITEADLAAVGLHPEVGEMAVRDVLFEWPFHDRDHLQQILSNARAWLWPDLGASQRFTELRGGEI